MSKRILAVEDRRIIANIRDLLSATDYEIRYSMLAARTKVH
jgi:hypothetical protein